MKVQEDNYEVEDISVLGLLITKIKELNFFYLQFESAIRIYIL
jgi:hypothetical protein